MLLTSHHFSMLLFLFLIFLLPCYCFFFSLPAFLFRIHPFSDIFAFHFRSRFFPRFLPRLQIQLIFAIITGCQRFHIFIDYWSFRWLHWIFSIQAEAIFADERYCTAFAVMPNRAGQLHFHYIFLAGQISSGHASCMSWLATMPWYIFWTYAFYRPLCVIWGRYDGDMLLAAHTAAVMFGSFERATAARRMRQTSSRFLIVAAISFARLVFWRY